VCRSVGKLADAGTREEGDCSTRTHKHAHAHAHTNTCVRARRRCGEGHKSAHLLVGHGDVTHANAGAGRHGAHPRRQRASAHERATQGRATAGGCQQARHSAAEAQGARRGDAATPRAFAQGLAPACPRADGPLRVALRAPEHSRERKYSDCRRADDEEALVVHPHAELPPETPAFLLSFTQKGGG